MSPIWIGEEVKIEKMLVRGVEKKFSLNFEPGCDHEVGSALYSTCVHCRQHLSPQPTPWSRKIKDRGWEAEIENRWSSVYPFQRYVLCGTMILKVVSSREGEKKTVQILIIFDTRCVINNIGGKKILDNVFSLLKEKKSKSKFLC